MGDLLSSPTTGIVADIFYGQALVENMTSKSTEHQCMGMRLGKPSLRHISGSVDESE